MQKLCDLHIHINDEQVFFLNEKVLSRYCGRMRIISNQEKRQCLNNTNNNKIVVEIKDFPCGPEGFELASRFCYNNGKLPITVSNVLILHCCSLYLEMTEDVCTNNLLQQTETFLEGIYYWTWNEILVSLRGCDQFYEYADNCGLLEKIMCALLAKIAQNSDPTIFTCSSSSSPSSPESNCHCANNKRLFSFSTPKTIKSSLPSKAWWFHDLSTLPPKIIEKFLQCIGAYRTDNNNLIITRFLLHYLKSVTNCRNNSSSEYATLAETAAYGVIFAGSNNKTFSCRALFWVLKVVSGFGLRRDCRMEMEKVIGGMLDQATLDDLLVSGHHLGLYYDVDFVIRLVKLFVDSSSNNGSDGVVCLQKLKKVGRLIDKYLREISPDQNLKISSFHGVAECLPDSARDCFDGVYRAIDIYLESHPMIPFEERSRLCRCLNYNKLSFESCKDLAKNPRIPPRIAMQALISQQAKIPPCVFATDEREIMDPSQIIMYNEANTESFSEEKEDMRHNLERMQSRVRELEKLCNEMKNLLSRFSQNQNGLLSPSCTRPVQRFC